MGVSFGTLKHVYSLELLQFNQCVDLFDIHGEGVSVGQSKEESGGALLGGSLFGVYS